MEILRKTFDDNESGIEVHDGEETYPFRLEQQEIGGKRAVYVGEDEVPDAVKQEVQDQSYASSIGYDVPGVVAEYVAKNGGGGTAGEIQLPEQSVEGETETLSFVHKDSEGSRITADAVAPTGGGISLGAADYISGSGPSEGVKPTLGLRLGGELPPVAAMGIGGTIGELEAGVAVRKTPDGASTPSDYSVLIGASVAPTDSDPPTAFAGVTPSTWFAISPRDVTAFTPPNPGLIATHDGSGNLPGGVFYYDGSSWVPLTDVTGTATFSGDGSKTTFTVSHGLGVTPTHVSVEAESADAAGNFYVSNKTDTDFEVTYTSAPADGTDNVALSYNVTA
jgi:hypothetical protein